MVEMSIKEIIEQARNTQVTPEKLKELQQRLHDFNQKFDAERQHQIDHYKQFLEKRYTL